MAYSEGLPYEDEQLLPVKGRSHEVNGLILRGPGARTGSGFATNIPRTATEYTSVSTPPKENPPVNNEVTPPKTYTVYQKDKAGREVRADTYTNTGTLVSTKTTAYTKAGKISKTETRDGAGNITSAASYAYDKDQNKTTETLTIYKGAIKDVTYNNYTDPTKSYHREYTGTNLTHTDKYDAATGKIAYTSMTYNSEGKTVTSVTKDAPGLAGKAITKTEYEYAQDGLTKTKTTVTKYEYYSNGEIKTEDVKYTDAKNASNSYHKKYYYDAESTLSQVDTIKGADKVVSSTAYEKDKETTKTFNNTGEVTAVEIKGSTLHEKSYYTNAGTRLTKKETIGEADKVTSSTTYSYNAEGKVSSEAFTTYNYAAGKLSSEKTVTTNKTTGTASQTQTVYTYDDKTGTVTASTKTTYKGTSDVVTGSTVTTYTEDGIKRAATETKDKNGNTTYTCTYYNDKNNRVASKTLTKPDKDGNVYFTYNNESGSPLQEASPYKPADLTKSSVAANDLIAGTARMQVEQLQAQSALPKGVGTGGLVTNTGAGEKQAQPSNSGNPI